MDKNSLENIVKNKFENASSPVPSGAWANVSSQVSGGIGTSGVAGISTLGKIVLGTLVAASIITAAILVTPETETKIEPPKTEVSNDQGVSPSVSEVTPIQESTKAKSVKSKTVNTPKQENQETNKDLIIDQKQLNEELIYDAKEDLIADHSEAGESSSQNESFSENSAEMVDEVTEDASAIETTDPEPVIIIPSKILSKESNQSGKSIEFYLNTVLPNDFTVKWYLNDEFKSNEDHFTEDFTFDSEVTVMAMIVDQDGENHSTLFFNERIELPAKIAVPNVITPNNDGINDYFDLDHKKSENIYWYKISVLTADGSPIFGSTEDQKVWTGDILGQEAQEGRYYYVIKYKTQFGEIQTKTGFVTLSR